MKKFILSLLEECPGEFSLTRAILLAAFAVCVILPLLVWACMTAWKGVAQEIPGSVSTFCGTMFAAASTLKAVQKFAEPK